MTHGNPIKALTALVLIIPLAISVYAAPPLDIEAIAQQNQPAAAVIFAQNADASIQLQGSGCCINTQGYFLTVAHQVAGCTQFQARMRDGFIHELTLLNVDPAREYALLKTTTPMPNAAIIGDASTLRDGSPLVAIAAPAGLEFSVVTGIVSSTQRVRKGFPMIQTDIPASPGSSGGPVFDRDGKLVGLIVNRLEQEAWIKMVTPINNAYPMLQQHGLLPTPSTTPPAEQLEIIPAFDVSPSEMQAIQAYNNGVMATDPTRKAECYRRATGLLPAFFEAWFNLATASTALGDNETARQAYLTALKLQPEGGKALAVRRNLGRLYLALHAYDDAIACFQEALRLAPQDPSAHNDLGEACRNAQRWTEAEQSFQRALELRPQYPAASYNLGLTYMGMKRPQEAAGQFRRYLELMPDASDAAQVKQWIQQIEGS